MRISYGLPLYVQTKRSGREERAARWAEPEAEAEAVACLPAAESARARVSERARGQLVHGPTT